MAVVMVMVMVMVMMMMMMMMMIFFLGIRTNKEPTQRSEGKQVLWSAAESRVSRMSPLWGHVSGVLAQGCCAALPRYERTG
eukprot:8800809-Pyramimonas_sp.AAC.1